MPVDSLHADAVAVLSQWAAPSPSQDELRRSYLDLLRAEPGAMRRSCVPAHLTGSALILDPVAERVLLLLHGRAGLWLQAGGHCEDGDGSLAATALREAAEESGISGLVLGGGGAPVKLDRHPAPCAPASRSGIWTCSTSRWRPPGPWPRSATSPATSAGSRTTTSRRRSAAGSSS